MASTTPRLRCERFVRQVSSGVSSAKSSFLKIQMDLVERLKVASWKIAKCSLQEVSTVSNKVTATDGKMDESGHITGSSYTAYIDDRYDAFKQAGDGDRTLATQCGYAGVVAYRYELPANVDANLVSVRATVQSSKYLRSGVRVVVAASESAVPTDDWDFIRGDHDISTDGGFVRFARSESTPAGEEYAGKVASWGVCSQEGVAYLTLSSPKSDTFAGDGDFNARGRKYLWIFLSVEDYSDTWDVYTVEDGGEVPRLYYIEGSATLVQSGVVFAFDGEVDDTDPEYRREAPPISEWTPAGCMGVHPEYPFYQDANLVDGYTNRFDGYMWMAHGMFQIVAYTRRLSDLFGAYKACCTMPSFGNAMTRTIVLEPTEETDKLDASMLGSVATVLQADAAKSSGPQVKPRGILFYARVPEEGEDLDKVSELGLAKSAYVTIGCSCVIVPGSDGSFFYNMILGSAFPDYDSLFANGANFSLLVWRTRSDDAYGHLSYFAITALAQNKEFFTGEASRISGQLKAGDESVSIDADLICTKKILSGDYVVNNTLGIHTVLNFVESVRRGDMLIVIPRWDGLTTNDGWCGLVDHVVRESRPSTAEGAQGVTPEVYFF